MAKLKGPLFSLGASQQIGKALVYFPWKGLNVVREYVTPSNPQTAPQTTQRGYLTNAVSRVHWAQARAANAMTATDTAAYALWASTVKQAMTWFNQCVKHMVDQQVDGNSYPIFYDGSVTPGANQLTVEVYAHVDSPDDGKFFYGTSKTALIQSEVAVIAGAHIDAVIAGLTSGVKYYVQFRTDAGDAAEGSRSGIYYGTPT